MSKLPRIFLLARKALKEKMLRVISNIEKNPTVRKRGLKYLEQ